MKGLFFAFKQGKILPMSKLRKFITKLKRLRYSAIEIFIEKQEQPKPITSLAPKVLTSKEDIEKIRPYLNRLLSALSNKTITNIALTGTYGSGKSTVIKTFQNIYKSKDPNNDFSYLNISLASFKDELIDEEEIEQENHKLEEQDSNENRSNENPSTKANVKHSKHRQQNFERLLEVSILQQMIYHVNPSKIPDSRFKRIENLTQTKLTSTALFFVLWLISAFSMWQFHVFRKINPQTWTFSIKDMDIISILIIGVFLGGLTNIIIRLIKTFGNSRISKISIKGELELGENVDKSILNQHLDEIIYFFQKTKFNVVVIEDLDRFRDTEIFTKLREINQLLNNSDLITRKIAFVYSIRDDMFQGHDRTKFFDYIIPIIPFINPSNANDKLTELLQESGINNNFSQNFIDNVVTFIDDIDMRLLTNILQEYLVYKENLTHDLKQDNLLAMIIYKNIYPRDFAKLHKNKGDLYDIIANKGSYSEDFILRLNNQITKNKSEVEKIEKEKVKNEKELRDVYLYNILKQLDNPGEIIIGRKSVTIDELSEDDIFNDLMEEQNITYYTYGVNRNYGGNHYNKTKINLNKSFSQIESEVDKIHTYFERLKIINSRNDNKLEELKEQNESLEKQKDEIKRWEIKKIFQSQDVTNYLGAFEDSSLIRSLLVNGYINENYLDYISLFHEVNITKGDYNFIRKVKSNESLGFDYKIEKLENVVRKIDESHFEKVAILNHQVVEFILKNQNQYSDRYHSLKELLKSENKIVIDFIDSYKRSEEADNAILFQELPKIWRGFWKLIADRNKNSEKKTNEYFQLIIQHTPLKDIENQSNIESFRNRFSELNNLGNLVRDKNQIEKLKSIIARFKTKFIDITNLHYNNATLYDYVVSNDYYAINSSNLLTIVIDEGGSEEGFKNANFTTIQNLENQLPLAYIEKHIETYITDVFLTLENIEESEAAMITLLNNRDLSISIRKLILESTIPIFHNLSDFNEIEIKEEILKQYIITPSWSNVMHYFNSYERENLDSILVDYLNNEKVYKELAKSNLSSLKEDKETKEKLALAIIYCDDLSLESHTMIRSCLYSSWNLISIEKLSYDKIESMVDSKFIKLSIRHYDTCREHFPDLHITLIERGFATYIKSHDEYEMNEEDHLSVLKSIDLIDSQKKSFLDTLHENQIVENPTIAELAVKVYANTKVDTLSYSFLLGLFKKSSSNQDRIKLFNLNASRITKTEAKNLIEQLSYPYNRLSKPRKQAKLSENAMNLEFTNHLKRLEVITSNRARNGMIKAVASRFNN